jgi:hypothetical protein
MVPYIEVYKIAGHKYAIEHYDDGKPLKDHFFFDSQPQNQRYKVWVSGCAIGNAATVEDARALLFRVAHSRMGREYDEAEATMKRIRAERFKLGSVKNLTSFKIIP